MKLQLGDRQPDVYSAVAHLTDGLYHVIKIIRRLSSLEFFVDGIRVNLEGGTSEWKEIRDDQQENDVVV